MNASTKFYDFAILADVKYTIGLMRCVKGEGKRVIHGDLICTYTLPVWHFCRRFMHYKRKKIYLWKVAISSVVSCLLQINARWRHRLDASNAYMIITTIMRSLLSDQ